MSDSTQTHRRQPTRLPHPWDSPDKNTGVGCHFLLHQFYAAAAKSPQSRLPLRSPTDGPPPSSPSLGPSRQEHWSELPPPSPMHESKIIGDWNAKVGSQETPGITGKFSLGVQNEAGQRLIAFCQENALVIANTHFQQHKRRLYTWTSPDGQHQNQIDYILCSGRWRSPIESAKQDLGLTVAQIMTSLLPNPDLN